MSAELELAGQVVELVRRIGGAGTEAEVTVEQEELSLTRFANSFIHQNVAAGQTTVRLRLHVDGRTASGSTTVVSPDGLAGLVERTVDAARLCPPDPAWPGLATPAPVVHSGSWDEATAYADPDERARRVRDFVVAAEGLETAGYCRTARRSGAFANSAGQSVSGRGAEAALDGIARAGGSDGTGRLAATRLADLDGTVLGARAAAKARAGVDPVELPPGRYEVVLEPTAVADVLQNLSWHGFDGKAHNERRSFAELGAAQFDPAVWLVDDPLDGPALPFDAEGTPRQRLVLVSAGVTRGVAHDRRTGAEAGARSTGHAIPGGAAAGAMPFHLGLLPAGAAAGTGNGVGTNPTDTDRTDTAAADTGVTEVAGPVVDSDTAALVSGMRRGLLVTDLWYTRVLDPKTLVVTGLTRNGVWLVEGGEVVRPVRDLRFTQSYPGAFAPGALLGLGRRAVAQPHSWAGAIWSAPAVRLAAWNFTGGASG